MRSRKLAALVVAVLLAGIALTRCNTCLLTRRHTGHDTLALNVTTSESKPVHGRPIPIYHFGTSGPHVILLHELPGFSRETIRLAETIAAAGYRVDAPLLFGGYGESKASLSRTIEACRAGFVHCWSGDSKPLVDFIRDELMPEAVKDGGRMAVIGMCLTGNAAAEVLSDKDLAKVVAGVVMSQPAMPMALTRGKMREIGLTGPAVEAIQQSGKPILAFRFTDDCISPPERMAEFERLLGKQIKVMQIDSGRCNHFGISESAHAVLTQEYRPSEPGHPTNAAVAELLRFLDATLKGVGR